MLAGRPYMIAFYSIYTKKASLIGFCRGENLINMGKLSFGKVLDWLCLSSGLSSSCFDMNSLESYADDVFEKKPLIPIDKGQVHRFKDIVSDNQTLSFHMKPKMVVLKVSMHCNGCARKVEKHVSKLEGVTAYKVDLKSKMVIIVGDIIPLDVLKSFSKVKYAELWNSPS